jgi:hypothetical protein
MTPLARCAGRHGRTRHETLRRSASAAGLESGGGLRVRGKRQAVHSRRRSVAVHVRLRARVRLRRQWLALRRSCFGRCERRCIAVGRVGGGGPHLGHGIRQSLRVLGVTDRRFVGRAFPRLVPRSGVAGLGSSCLRQARVRTLPVALLERLPY